jgi:hypothetical protein
VAPVAGAQHGLAPVSRWRFYFTLQRESVILRE